MMLWERRARAEHHCVRTVRTNNRWYSTVPVPVRTVSTSIMHACAIRSRTPRTSNSHQFIEGVESKGCRSSSSISILPLGYSILSLTPQHLWNMSSKLVSSALKSSMNLHSSKLPKEIIKSSQAWFAAAPSSGTHKLPDLPYDYNALERKWGQVFCLLAYLLVCYVWSIRWCIKVDQAYYLYSLSLSLSTFISFSRHFLRNYDPAPYQTSYDLCHQSCEFALVSLSHWDSSVLFCSVTLIIDLYIK